MSQKLFHLILILEKGQRGAKFPKKGGHTSLNSVREGQLPLVAPLKSATVLIPLPLFLPSVASNMPFLSFPISVNFLKYPLLGIQ